MAVLRSLTALVLALALASAAHALDFAEARHLLNRTGFGASPAEIAAYLPLDRAAAVDRLLGSVRRGALGNFRDLLYAVARDPAMVIYLDNQTNRAGNPNENFARELLELFTLGEGHYSEQDVKEAARAFTGWMVDRKSGGYRFNPR